jgi:hypothetical protein
MGIKVTINKKFIVNGKEYRSLDEMPQNIREAYEKALSVSAGGGLPVGPPGVTARITFNGKSYAGVEEMPADVRQAYESLMAAVEGGKETVPGAVPLQAVSAKPIEPSSPSSLSAILWKIVAAVALGLMLLYVVRRIMG